jgi:protein O-GlcNAcase/histone acetyltransferase
MSVVGVRHFALLFDDLPGEISQQDRDEFPSVASAQASITNSIYEWLGAQSDSYRLLFCPTPYCDRMDRQDLGGADYLDRIGRELHRQIEVFWTGPAIISEHIPPASIDALATRIGRKPVIWDNLHANDYDQRRLYCGPYSRSNALRDSVHGILLNPNNEFPINFIPLQTLGDYLNRDDYQPRAAYLSAAAAWSKQFTTISSQVSAEDVVLLGDCHYLPFSDGDQAQRLESHVVTLLEKPVDDWGDTLQQFEAFHDRVARLLENLSQLTDRELFYAWSRRIWDLREELDLISDFAKAKQGGNLDANRFVSESHLPATYRGGFVANLQRQLEMDAEGRFKAT